MIVFTYADLACMMSFMMAKATSRVNVTVIRAKIAINIGRLESGSAGSVGSEGNFSFKVKLNQLTRLIRFNAFKTFRCFSRLADEISAYT